MLTITKTYTDFDGNKRTEGFMFNFTKAELMEMELFEEGGYTAMAKKIVDAKDNTQLAKLFKDLVLKAYGIKSPDGRRFIKSDKLREEFTQTEAYSEIFMELATDDKKAAEFVNGIIPGDIDRAELEKVTSSLSNS